MKRWMSATPWVRTVFLLCTAAGSGFAAQDRHSHTAHVHGVAAMNLAIDGAELYLELRSPAANLVGFEHPPGNAEERGLIERAQGLLETPTQLFLLPAGAGCRLAEADIEMPWPAEDTEQAESSSGDGAGHRHDEHGHHAHDDEGHTDIHADYRFVCDSPAALERVEVLMFDVFPMIQRLEVQTVTPAGQAASVLSPDQRLLRL